MWKTKLKFQTKEKKKMGDSKMKPICVCFKEDEIDELKKKSHYQLMSVSEFIRHIWHEWLEKHKNDEV